MVSEVFINGIIIVNNINYQLRDKYDEFIKFLDIDLKQREARSEADKAIEDFVNSGVFKNVKINAIQKQTEKDKRGTKKNWRIFLKPR